MLINSLLDATVSFSPVRDKIYPLTPGTWEYSLAKHIQGEEERGEREYE